MLIFISNEPRNYSWGSKEAIPEILQKNPTGEPQAELWLGDHAGDPATIDNTHGAQLTLIDLIKSNPKVYGVNNGPLPFLLKILGIGRPLSLQVHPDKEAAVRGYANEEEAGIALDSVERSYKDQNHKPELLVALTPVKTLKGFRPVAELREDLGAIVRHAGTCGAKGAQPLFALILMLQQNSAGVAISRMLDWIFSGSKQVQETLGALHKIFVTQNNHVPGMSAVRVGVLKELLEKYPRDPGVLVALMTNIVELEPLEAVYIAPGTVHAYLNGVGVEVMASSDNVLRAGLTDKHVDVTKMREILNENEERAESHQTVGHQTEGNQGEGLFRGVETAQGLTLWDPGIKDFKLYRVAVTTAGAAFEESVLGAALNVKLDAPDPIVLLVTEGQVVVERLQKEESGAAPLEVARVKRGKSLYISRGEKIEITGNGVAFLATVGG